MKLTLSQPALEVIQNYLALPFPGKNVSCPYFNNRRAKVRAGLRALVGKGSAEDIVEEAVILSLREKINLEKLNNEELKKFLVDNNLGIDCSALSYHILDAEAKAQGLGSLHKILKRPWFKNPFRKLLVKLRPVENTGVGTLNHEVNSVEVNLKDIRPGDMIIIMGAGPKQDYNHVLLVTNVILRSEATKELSKPTSDELQKTNIPQSTFSSKDSSSPSTSSGSLGMTITYIHSFQYPNDGLYNHGVRQEKIEITDINKSLLEQNWSEPQMKDYARGAKEFKIKRLKAIGC